MKRFYSFRSSLPVSFICSFSISQTSYADMCFAARGTVDNNEPVAVLLPFSSATNKSRMSQIHHTAIPTKEAALESMRNLAALESSDPVTILLFSFHHALANTQIRLKALTAKRCTFA